MKVCSCSVFTISDVTSIRSQFRLFTALYFLVFLFDRGARGYNHERTGRQHQREVLTG